MEKDNLYNEIYNTLFLALNYNNNTLIFSNNGFNELKKNIEINISKKLNKLKIKNDEVLNYYLTISFDILKLFLIEVVKNKDLQLLHKLLYFPNNNTLNIDSLLYTVIKKYFLSKKIDYDHIFNTHINNKFNFKIYFNKSAENSHYSKINIFITIITYIKYYVCIKIYNENKYFNYFLQKLNLVKNNKLYVNHLSLGNFENIFILFQEFQEKYEQLPIIFSLKNNINQNNIQLNNVNVNNIQLNNIQLNSVNVNNIQPNNIKQKLNKILLNKEVNNEIYKKIDDYINNIYFVEAHGGLYINKLYLLNDDYILSFQGNFDSFGKNNFYDNTIVGTSSIELNNIHMYKNIKDTRNYYQGMFIPNMSLNFNIMSINKTHYFMNNNQYSGIINLYNAFIKSSDTLNSNESYLGSKIIENLRRREITNENIINKLRKTKINNTKNNVNNTSNTSNTSNTTIKKLINKIQLKMYKFNDNKILPTNKLINNNHNIELYQLIKVLNIKNIKKKSRFIFNICRSINKKQQNIINELKEIVKDIININNIILKINNQVVNINNNISFSSKYIRSKNPEQKNYNIFEIIDYIENIFTLNFTNNNIKREEIKNIKNFINNIKNNKSKNLYEVEYIKNNIKLILSYLKKYKNTMTNISNNNNLNNVSVSGNSGNRN